MAIAPDAVTNIENVGVAPCGIESVTEADGDERQDPVEEFVWQSVTDRGNDTPPVSAPTVIVPPAFPALSVATAKAPLLPTGTVRMPFPDDVASSATMLAVGEVVKFISTLLKPVMLGKGILPSPLKTSGKPACVEATVEAKSRTKVAFPPAVMLTGVLGVPIGALVAGLVC